MSDPDTNLKLYGEKCAKLLNESEIRFAGIVDKEWSANCRRIQRWYLPT